MTPIIQYLYVGVTGTYLRMTETFDFYLLSFGSSIGFSLLLSGSLLELHVTELHNGRCTSVQGHLLFISESQNSKSLL